MFIIIVMVHLLSSVFCTNTDIILTNQNHLHCFLLNDCISCTWTCFLICVSLIMPVFLIQFFCVSCLSNKPAFIILESTLTCFVNGFQNYKNAFLCFSLNAFNQLSHYRCSIKWIIITFLVISTCSAMLSQHFFHRPSFNNCIHLNIVYKSCKEIMISCLLRMKHVSISWPSVDLSALSLWYFIDCSKNNLKNCHIF